MIFSRQGAILERSERGLSGGVQQSDDELTFLPVGFRGLGRGGDLVFRETRQLRAICDQRAWQIRRSGSKPPGRSATVE